MKTILSKEDEGSMLIGKDLADWRIETWWMARVYTDDRGNFKSMLLSEDKNKDLLESDLCDVYAKKCLVLTKDGKTGFVISGKQIILNDQDKIHAEFVKKVKTGNSAIS